MICLEISATDNKLGDLAKSECKIFSVYLELAPILTRPRCLIVCAQTSNSSQPIPSASPSAVPMGAGGW